MSLPTYEPGYIYTGNEKETFRFGNKQIGDEFWSNISDSWRPVDMNILTSSFILYRRKIHVSVPALTEWIKMSERIPTDKDFPIWSLAKNHSCYSPSLLYSKSCNMWAQFMSKNGGRWYHLLEACRKGYSTTTKGKDATGEGYRSL